MDDDIIKDIFSRAGIDVTSDDAHNNISTIPKAFHNYDSCDTFDSKLNNTDMIQNVNEQNNVNSILDSSLLESTIQNHTDGFLSALTQNSDINNDNHNLDVNKTKILNETLKSTTSIPNINSILNSKYGNDFDSKKNITNRSNSLPSITKSSSLSRNHPYLRPSQTQTQAITNDILSSVNIPKELELNLAFTNNNSNIGIDVENDLLMATVPTQTLSPALSNRQSSKSPISNHISPSKSQSSDSIYLQSNSSLDEQAQQDLLLSKIDFSNATNPTENLISCECFYGFMASSKDALLLLTGCRSGALNGLKSRPKTAKAATLKVRSGSIIVFEEDISKMRRWRDGLKWTPSRISGPFLIYKELDLLLKSPLNSESSNSSRNGYFEPNEDLNSTFTKGLDPPFGNMASNEAKVKYDGLIKKTFAATYDGRKYHIISYYSRNDVLSGKLMTPELWSNQKGISIEEGMWDEIEMSGGWNINGRRDCRSKDTRDKKDAFASSNALQMVAGGMQSITDGMTPLSRNNFHSFLQSNNTINNRNGISQRILNDDYNNSPQLNQNPINNNGFRESHVWNSNVIPRIDNMFISDPNHTSIYINRTTINNNRDRQHIGYQLQQQQQQQQQQVLNRTFQLQMQSNPRQGTLFQPNQVLTSSLPSNPHSSFNAVSETYNSHHYQHQPQQQHLGRTSSSSHSPLSSYFAIPLQHPVTMPLHTAAASSMQVPMSSDQSGHFRPLDDLTLRRSQ